MPAQPSIPIWLTQRDNPVNLQYEVFFNYVKISFVLNTDVTVMLLSVTVQSVESTVQDVETNGNIVNLTAFFLLKIF